MVKIYHDDAVYDIAHKIFYNFDIHNSCTIFGFVRNDATEELIPKGQLVWEQLERIDFEVNCRTDSSGKKIRNYKYVKESIGGPIAHKIFRRDIKIDNKEPRWTIWRTQ